MNTMDNLYERIDAYLNGTMSEADKQAFENHMAGTPSLAEEVDIQRHVQALILEKSLADIRRQVGEDLSRLPAASPGKILMTAALCILVTGGLYWWLESFSKKTPVVSHSFDTMQLLDLNHTDNMEKEAAYSKHQKEKKATVSKKQSTAMDTGLYEASVKPESASIKPQRFSADTVSVPAFLKQQQVDEGAVKETSVPCPDILFSIHTEASCSNNPSGSVQILLSSILGGIPPYKYAVNGQSQSHSLLTELAAGTYTVTVLDSRGCNAEQQVTVREKNCTVFKDYSFNPNTETWKLPFLSTESGTISIMDKSGNVVYKTSVIQGQPYEWNGRSLSGSSLELGSYLYIATSTDGESRQGYIILLQ